MPDLFILLRKWWKQALGIVLVSLIIVSAITFLQPRQYLSVATALPANSYLADQARVFNENIEGLYSVMGTADELEMIIGTGQLDTIYLSVTDQLDLANHFDITGKNEAARYKAAMILRKNSRVMKSEYGELKVRVWDKNKEIASLAANTLMDKIQELHSNLQNTNNLTTLRSLVKGSESIRRSMQSQGEKQDSGFTQLPNASMLAERLDQYEKMIGHYQLMADTKPAALLIVEKARPAERPDKPRWLPIILITFFLSILFAILAILLIDKKNPGV